MQYVHAEFCTVVRVGENLTVTGTLPGTRWRPEGAIAIGGDVGRLWREQARQLAVALQLVADRMDAVADERYGATDAASGSGSAPVQCRAES